MRIWIDGLERLEINSPPKLKKTIPRSTRGGGENKRIQSLPRDSRIKSQKVVQFTCGTSVRPPYALIPQVPCLSWAAREMKGVAGGWKIAPRSNRSYDYGEVY